MLISMLKISTPWTEITLLPIWTEEGQSGREGIQIILTVALHDDPMHKTKYNLQ